MPKVLEATKVDTEQEQADTALTAAEEAEVAGMFNQPTGVAPDLSDGGKVGDVNLYPVQGGKRQTEGRATVRRAWMWNGTESMLPLAWNPDGTMHDNARRYILKRHCLCCNTGGFRARPGRPAQCPNCVKNHCQVCQSSTDSKMIIPLFYLNKAEVPYPTQFYGTIPCFLETCPRKNRIGFLTEQAMRIHAATRHTMEYTAFQEAEQAKKVDQVDVLQRRLDDLMSGSVAEQSQAKKRNGWTPERRKAASEAARARTQT